MKKTTYLVCLFLFINIGILDTLAQENRAVRRGEISPSLVTLETKQTVQFSIIKQAADWRPTVLSTAVPAEQVVWSVNGIVGGTEEFGTIDEEGIYTAPEVTPSPREIHITGEVDDLENQKMFATVLMEAKSPIYTSVYDYSESVEESKYFDEPHGVAIDLEGNLIIADEQKHHVVRFSQEGEFLGFIGGGAGQQDGQFHKPRTILIDTTDGDIYVSDQKVNGNRIQIFTSDGQFKKSFGTKGTDQGSFRRIHGMNFDNDGNLYVVDVDNYRVTKMSHQGEFIACWGERGIYGNELNEPHGLAMGPNNDLFVSSYYGTIKKFNANGRFLFGFAEANPPQGFVYIHSITGDKWGNVYGMVRGMSGFGGQLESAGELVYSVAKYNNNGDFVCGIHLSNTSHSETWAAVDDATGYICVLHKGSDTAGFEIFAPQ